MKGIPWTVDHDLTIADELVIGIGTAELSDSRMEDGSATSASPRYSEVTGTTCSASSRARRPTRSTRRCSATRPRDIISEIKKRNGWQPGDTVRIVFTPPGHPATPTSRS